MAYTHYIYMKKKSLRWLSVPSCFVPLPIVSKPVCVAALWYPESLFDYLGLTVGILSLLVTVLIGWNIYTLVDLKSLQNKLQGIVDGTSRHINANMMITEGTHLMIYHYLMTGRDPLGIEFRFINQYGTPYYITIDERNTIAETPMPTKHLETQRDIFVFHCFVGCRVSDLIKLTEANITNGILEYTPHKTKDEGEQAVMARVPLHPKAVGLIEKYKGVDAKGRLFPFISPQKYNDAIKEVFTIAGITRNVEIRDAKTGEMEIRPINEIASSHLARRTFVGNAYRKVSDPNIIGKMSGHVEGSKAFSRYRNIEDETLKSVIDLIG